MDWTPVRRRLRSGSRGRHRPDRGDRRRQRDDSADMALALERHATSKIPDGAIDG